MKTKRRKRLFVAVLCAVLCMTDTLSVGMQAYAKAPDVETIDEKTGSTDAGTKEIVTDDMENGDVSGTEDGTGSSDQPGDGDGAEAGDGTESSDQPGNGEGTEAGDGTENGNQPGDGEGTEADGGTESGDQSDDGEGTEPGDDTENSDNSVGDEGAGDGTEPGTETEEVTDSDQEPEDGDAADAEMGTEPGEEVEADAEADQVQVYASQDEGEYLTEDPQGYNLSYRQMNPGSYKAVFWANSSKFLEPGSFQIMYTTDADAAQNFYKDKSKIKATALTGSGAAGFSVAKFQDFHSTIKESVFVSNGVFVGEGALKPNTTYYYRLVYYSYEYEREEGASSSVKVEYYSFLTDPEQFTTGAPVESSAVSVKDVTVETGYRNIKVFWSVDNPNLEDILVNRFTYQDGTAEKERPALEYSEYDEAGNYTKIPNRYYTTINAADAGQVSHAKITVKVHVGEDTEYPVIFDVADISLKNKADAELSVTEKVGNNKFKVAVSLAPTYDVDGGMPLRLYYRVKESQDKYKSESGCANALFEIDGLLTNTKYEYYIEARDNTRVIDVPPEWLTQLGSVENPKEFCTKESVTIADSEFPDEVFRKYLRKELGLEESDPITSDKLETLTSIAWWRNSTDGEIKSLQGISHLENLRWFYVVGHTVTDVGDISALNELEDINLRENDLTEMPDLSSMPKLSGVLLAGNKMRADSISADKLPALFLEKNPDWIETTKQEQRGEISWKLAPEYYASGEERPFAIRVQNLRFPTDISYTLKLTIGGKSVSSTRCIGSGSDMRFYITDILKAQDGTATGISVADGNSYSVGIVLTDEYGTRHLETTETVKFMADIDVVPKAETLYVNSSMISGISLWIGGLPLTLEEENVKSVKLEDQNGSTFEVTGAKNISESTYDRYSDTLGEILELRVKRKGLQASLSFTEPLPAGEYSAVITTTGGTTYRAARAVVVKGGVDRKTVVLDLTVSENYDQRGDYVYVDMKGCNIDPVKIRPIFYSGKKQITEYAGAAVKSDDTVTYKLRKVRQYRLWTGRSSYDYQIDADEGYEYIDETGVGDYNYKSCVFDFELNQSHDFVVFEHYNYKKSLYEVKSDVTVAEGTEVSVSVYTDSAYSSLAATGKAEVSNGQLAFQFKNAQGDIYAPPQRVKSYFRYSYVNGDNILCTFDHAAEVKWYNYDGTIGGTWELGFGNTGGQQKAYFFIFAKSRETFPCTVTITRPYDTEPIKEFSVPASVSAGDLICYYFTEADVEGTDPQEIYMLRAKGVDGTLGTAIGYIASTWSTRPAVDATGITINKTALNLQVGQTETLTATVQPANATDKKVTWSSGDETVATVDTQGRVTALQTGKATITAATSNGKTAECEVQVTDYALSKTELTFELPLDQNRTETLQVTEGGQAVENTLVTWSSTDAAVAAVSAAGVVTPKKAGTANILAAVKSGPTLICKVTVTRDVESIRMAETTCELRTGDTKQMTLRFDPSDSNYTGTVVWSSADSRVATVNENGLVMAVGAGETSITAEIAVKTGTLKAECKVTVKEVTQKPAEDKIPTGLTALTNEQLTLGDVELPEGWKWCYPEVALKQFAGMQAKTFAAEYTESTESAKEPYRTGLPVKMTTVTGITVHIADGGSVLRENDTAELTVEWKYNGAPMDLTSYEKDIVWSSSKESVATVAPADHTKKASLQAKSSGKAVITAKIAFAENKTYQVKYNVTVTKDAPAQITAVTVENFTANADQSVHQGTVETRTSTLQVTMTGAAKLAVKSNNTKVVSVGKAAVEGEQYKIPLTVKAAGAAEITLTANDEAKTARTVRLEVTDPTPQISESTLTVNLQQTTGTTFYLYPNEGCTVKEASLDGDTAASFELRADGNDRYTIFAKENTAKGSYKLTLRGTALCNGQEKSYSGIALTVKVADTKPKYKVKQNGKVNVFYKNAKSRLDITSEETLESVTLGSDCDFTLERGEDGAYYLAAKTSGGQSNGYQTQGKLTLQFAGYKPLEAPVRIAVENKKPRLALESKSVTFYPAMGLSSARIGVKADGKAYNPASGSVSIENAEHFTITADGGKLLLQGAGLENRNASIRATVKLQDSVWSEAIALSCTIKTKTGNPAVKLQKASLQLNANDQTWTYDTAATAIMWKDGAEFEAEGVTVQSSDGKTSDILFSYDRESRQIIARLNRQIGKGIYKFLVKVNVTEQTTVTTPLTVKVVDVQKDKAVKISAKGTIDVLNRSGSFVTVTPSLKSLNGAVAGVTLTGRAAHLFRAECGDGQIRIYAKEDMALITKYPYKVKLNLVIENAEKERTVFTTSDVTLKLKQTRPKVTIAPKSAAFFSGAYNSADRKITAVIKGAQAPVIENVELINNQSAFTCAYEDGTVTLQSTKGAVKGKSYSLQFKLTFEGQADNEKAVTVKYTVKVK